MVRAEYVGCTHENECWCQAAAIDCSFLGWMTKIWRNEAYRKVCHLFPSFAVFGRTTQQPDASSSRWPSTWPLTAVGRHLILQPAFVASQPTQHSCVVVLGTRSTDTSTGRGWRPDYFNDIRTSSLSAAVLYEVHRFPLITCLVLLLYWRMELGLVWSVEMWDWHWWCCLHNIIQQDTAVAFPSSHYLCWTLSLYWRSNLHTLTSRHHFCWQNMGLWLNLMFCHRCQHLEGVDAQTTSW